MAETYSGKPCKVCGGTERRRNNRGCIYRNRKDHLIARGALERNREWEHKRRATPEYREQSRQSSRVRMHKRIEMGLCAYCNQPKLSEWSCYDCLNKKEMARVLSL